MNKKMKEVPNIISGKDLLYIKDMMSWNLILNKKIYSYLDLITDEEIKKEIKQVMKMHKTHYEELLGILE